MFWTCHVPASTVLIWNPAARIRSATCRAADGESAANGPADPRNGSRLKLIVGGLLIGGDRLTGLDWTHKYPPIAAALKSSRLETRI
jgi:hypothetical protein